MYEEHEEFYPPPPDATLWRYMDFTKFVSILDKKALFFSRADKLGDPFEGSYSRINQVMRPTWLKQGGVPPEQIPRAIESLAAARNVVGKMPVCCWHENDFESEAMWNRYGGDSGIAIKTTMKGLSECFKCRESIFVGRIKYIDYDTTPVAERNLFIPLLNKRNSFEHEREVRVVASVFEHSFEFGEYFKVDISSLIHEVIVAPFSQEWFVNLVRSVADRYGLKASVLKSSMDDDPVR